MHRKSAVSDDRPDEGNVGLYGPDSEMWRLNREGILLLAAGPRALLLQIAHPLIAEGVDQFSSFRVDPWSRLRDTTRSYLTIVYGSTPVARAEIARLNRLHRAFTGPVRDADARERSGVPSYAARDPELSLWVHATLVDSILVAYAAWISPLSGPQRARAYAETLPVGRAFGIPAELLPTDIEAFDRYMTSMLGPDGPAHVSSLGRELSTFVLHPRLTAMVPALTWVPPAAYDWLTWPAIALLPADVREEFGLPWGADRAAVAEWLRVGLIRGRLLFSPAVRWFPIASRAYRRVGRSATSGQ
jgi:uncharacterized protein (DUF2236 family)